MKPRVRSRSSSALRVLFALALGSFGSACAGTIEQESTLPSASDARDVERIEELETRIAELERDLSRTPTTPTESVVITSEATPSREENPVLADAGTFALAEPDVATAPETQTGPRTVLRLHESRPSAIAVPVVTERLPVVEIPAVQNPANAGAPPSLAAPVASADAATHVATTPAVPPSFVANSTPTTLPIVGLQAPAVVSSTPVTTTVTPSTPASTDDLTDYRAGLAHLTGRRYASAVASLSAFLRDHPGSAQSDSALYWRATAQYALRNYREALVDYERVVRVAPRGERAADSLYHAGLCHRRLGDTSRATSSFARLQRDYPTSVAARLALREDTT